MPDLPEDLLERSPEEGARRVALAFLREARDASARLEDDPDGEALHDFRVAIRRLRCTLRAWRDEIGDSVRGKDRRALRALQEATGAGRDAEVALAWVREQRPALAPAQRRGCDWLERRLTGRRSESSSQIRGELLADFEPVEARLRRRLELLRVERHLRDEEPTRGEVFATAFAERSRAAGDAAARLLARVSSPDDEKACHRARIACKRLRYLVEPVRPHVPEARDIVRRCKRLQDVLGDIHDAHVLRAELRSALEDAVAEQARRLHELTVEEDAAALRRESRRSPRAGLLELTRRVQARLGELFAKLRDEWIAEGGARLAADVAAMAERLEREAAGPVEIERKFLLRGLPPIPDGAEVLEVDQGWLPGDRLRERIRRQRTDDGTCYFRTLKFGQGVQRIELEEATTPEVFDGLWILTKDCRVRKRRYRVRTGDRVFEIDEFLDRELVLAEVELPDPAAPPDIPAWLEPWVVREVTDDVRYTNFELARSGERAPVES